MTNAQKLKKDIKMKASLEKKGVIITYDVDDEIWNLSNYFYTTMSYSGDEKLHSEISVPLGSLNRKGLKEAEEVTFLCEHVKYEQNHGDW